MTLSSQRIDAVISAGLSDWLRSQGFRKKRRTFRRWDGPICLIVNVQASGGNTWDAARFYVNLAVYSAEHSPPSAKPQEHEGHLRRRLEPPEGGWWTLTPETDACAVASEVVTLLAQEGLPWLQRESALLTAYRELGEAQAQGRATYPPDNADGLGGP